MYTCLQFITTLGTSNTLLALDSDINLYHRFLIEEWRSRHQGLQGLSSGGCFLVTKARGASSSEGGGGVPHPELAGE